METGARGSTDREGRSRALHLPDHHLPSGSVKETTQSLSFQDFMLRQNRILDRRARVFKGRQNLLVKRQALRQLRQYTHELETSFLSTLEKHSSRWIADRDHSLADSLKELRRTKEKTAREEHTYDQDENALAIDEHELSVEEYQLFRDFATSLFPDAVTIDQTTSAPVLRQRSPQAAVPAPNVPAPIHEYETKIGQANILRETLDELDLEREEYLERRQSGLELDPDELKFLESYTETHEQSQDQLREVEKEIKRLEPAALETGLLSPSARYIPVPATPPLSPLMLPTTIVNLDQQTNDPVSHILIDFRESDYARPNSTNDQPTLAAGADFTSKAPIDRWLEDLPTFAQQVSETTSTFATFTTREGSRLIRYCKDHVLGSQERTTISLPDCDTGWVNIVDTTPRSKPSPQDNLDLPPQPQNMERVCSTQSRSHKEVLEMFPALDLASSVADTAHGQSHKRCNSQQTCHDG